MAIWSDYLISAIWKKTHNGSQYVSEVALHSDSEKSIGIGHRKTKDEVIALIKANKKVRTIKWNYSSANWIPGAFVTYEVISGVEYLRTRPDATETDNLDNMIPMDSYMI